MATGSSTVEGPGTSSPRALGPRLDQSRAPLSAMEALRAPFDAVRRRVNRGIALHRAVPCAEVDAAAVRRFWRQLALELRLEVLRFTDAAVVQRVHDAMIRLLRAEIWSRMNDVTEPVVPRLEGFEFEAPAERDCLGGLRKPIAIMATEDFAADEQLLEALERQLGSPFLEGRPALQPKDWSTATRRYAKWLEVGLQPLAPRAA